MQSVLVAAQSGDEVQALEAMRDRLAVSMDDSSSGAIGQTAAQLLAVLRRLSELTPSGKVTLDDALARRRELRADRAPSAKRATKPAG